VTVEKQPPSSAAQDDSKKSKRNAPYLTACIIISFFWSWMPLLLLFVKSLYKCSMLAHTQWSHLSAVSCRLWQTGPRNLEKFAAENQTYHKQSGKSIAKRIREQKLESSLIKSLSEKMINSVLFGSGRWRTWSRHHYSVQWRRAVSVSQHALRAALHIANIDFELN